MNKYRWMVSLSLAGLMASTAYGQVNLQSDQIKTVSGSVTNSDFVGNTLSIMTNDQQAMSFSVTGNAIITQVTHDIGLMDIKVGDPVTVKYDTSSSGGKVLVTLVDNRI